MKIENFGEKSNMDEVQAEALKRANRADEVF